MAEFPTLIISQEDFQKISALLSMTRIETAELLEEELARASVMPLDQVPEDIVVMNSKVTFVDLDSDKQHTITLTYPTDANIESNKISVLAPIGAALIGLRVGQTIDWPLPDNKIRRLKVASVLRDL